MKQNWKLISTVSILLFATYNCFSQKKPLLPLTADSLTTGNYKDVFKSFFQLAFDKFTSKEKEIQFSSNPFAVMAKIDTALLVDYNYYKYRHLRALNFAFAAKLDSSYKFNGFSSSLKYALVNERDETISKEFVTSAYEANNEYNLLNNSSAAYISKINIDDPRRDLYRSQANNLFAGKINFSEMDIELQNIIKSEAEKLKLENFLALLKKNEKLNLGEVKRLTYDSLRKLFQKGVLWTVGLSDTTYKDQFLFSNIVLSTQLLKGISNPLKPVGVEIDIKGALNFVDDSLKIGRDLQRSILLFEPGLNLLFKVKRTQYSWGEFKLSGSYTHIFNGAYANEPNDNLTLNATLRIRIINDIWIPLEIKYDPDTGNVFGFLNVRANFTGLGQVAKSLTK